MKTELTPGGFARLGAVIGEIEDTAWDCATLDWDGTALDSAALGCSAGDKAMFLNIAGEARKLRQTLSESAAAARCGARGDSNMKTELMPGGFARMEAGIQAIENLAWDSAALDTNTAVKAMFQKIAGEARRLRQTLRESTVFVPPEPARAARTSRTETA